MACTGAGGWPGMTAIGGAAKGRAGAGSVGESPTLAPGLAGGGTGVIGHGGNTSTGRTVCPFAGPNPSTSIMAVRAIILCISRSNLAHHAIMRSWQQTSSLQLRDSHRNLHTLQIDVPHLILHLAKVLQSSNALLGLEL